MTSPINPTVNPQAPPVASPAPGASGMDDEIRQLARALNPPQSPSVASRKAVVDSVSLGDGSTPPTITIDLDGVLIPNVRVAANYSPQVGDTVVLMTQDGGYVALFKTQDVGSKSDGEAGGWITASLASGNSHRSGSTVRYRRVLDHGAWKMQWKGNMDYGNSVMLSSALAEEYRPSEPRPLAAGRSLTGGLPTLRIDFEIDGTINIWGANYNGGGTTVDGVSNHTHGGATDYAGNSHTHSHNGTVPQTSFGETHAHGIFSSDLSHSHSLSITSPPWISLNGLEYFL